MGSCHHNRAWLLSGCLLLLTADAKAQTPPPPPASPAAVAAATAEVRPPEGWWVPATLKLPKAAEGRIAWRFTLTEVITVDEKGQLERRPLALSAVKANTLKSELPVPMLLELDDKQSTLTVTVLKPKTAFFTLNPAGQADAQRFDKLVINVHADSAEVAATCDRASSCARRSGHDELIPAIEEKGPSGQRNLTSCRDALSTIRQDLAAAHRAIPTICR